MRYKKLICGLLCATVLMAVPVSVVPVYANEQIQDLQDQIDALEKKKQEAQNSLAGIQDDKEKEIANRNAIVTEIDSTVQQITLLQEQIDIIASDMESKNQAIEGKNEEIADKEDEIQDKMDDIDENYELLKQRLRASYMSNGATTLDLIMGAKSFGEFLSQSEMTRKIAEHDQAILEQLRADQKVLEEDLQDLEQSKADLEAAKADLEVSKSSLEETQSAVNSKKSELDQLYQASSNQIAELSSLEAEFEADIAAYQQKAADMEQEIQRIYASLQTSSSQFVGGEFSWPLVGFSQISSYYGWRFNGQDFHTGIDITGSGVNGAPIYAANSGTVAFVQQNYTPGYSYGKYVIIDHGGGYSTLYAHCSAINVVEGQVVAQGEQIANVGSTGWSTGPHLHFEIRVNGQSTDPMGYFQLAG